MLLRIIKLQNLLANISVWVVYYYRKLLKTDSYMSLTTYRLMPNGHIPWVLENCTMNATDRVLCPMDVNERFRWNKLIYRIKLTTRTRSFKGTLYMLMGSQIDIFSPARSKPPLWHTLCPNYLLRKVKQFSCEFSFFNHHFRRILSYFWPFLRLTAHIFFFQHFVFVLVGENTKRDFYLKLDLYDKNDLQIYSR